MGVISITQRSERLGNIGGTSAAHGVTSTDIGTVHHTTARVFTPHYYGRNAHAGDAAVAAGLGKIGDTMLNIASAVQQREEDRQVDEYTNAMMLSMEKQSRDDRDITDWNTPQRQHLKDQKRGFYLRTGEGTKTVVDEWETCFGQTFKDIGDSIGANERVRERTMKNLATYRRGVVGRLANNQASEYRRMELGEAQGTLDTQAALWKNGNTDVLPDIFKQQERVSALKLLTPEQARASREALAVRLAGDFVQNSLDGCQTPEDFDKVEEAVKDGLKDRLPDEIARNLPSSDGTVGGETKKALHDEVKRSKRIFLAQQEAQNREKKRAVTNDFTEKELAIRDVPEELWAEAYENLGRHATLRKTDPTRALHYLNTAREMREATAKAKANAAKAAAKAIDDAAKAEIKANENGLASALCQLQMLELEGSIPQDAANEAQAAIWRKFRTCALGRTVSPTFMQTFKNRMETRLSDQEANAMRKFYRAFGYKGEVNEHGEIPASDRKKDTSDYAAPREPGDRHSENYFRIPAADLFVYGDTLLHTLRALGPDMNREGVVEKEIARLKTDWGKRQYDKNRDATVRSVMDMQREARMRWEMAQPEKQGEDDDGRRNGNAAK